MISIENDNSDIDKFHKRLEQTKNNPYQTANMANSELSQLKKLGYDEKRLYNESKYLKEAREHLDKNQKFKQKLLDSDKYR